MMLKYAVLLALGASSALATDTIRVGDTDVEISKMDCSINAGKIANKYDDCLDENFNFIPCASEDLFCMKKGFTGFAQCRPADRLWKQTTKIIKCADGSGGGNTGGDTTGGNTGGDTTGGNTGGDTTGGNTGGDTTGDKTVTTGGDTGGDTTGDKTVTTTTTTTMMKKVNPRNPNEGNSCAPADLFDANGDQKCQCAGNLWRCADTKDPTTKACDVGFQCIRKNKFYAICADPNGSRAEKLRKDGWEMTILPCGVDVGTYGY